MDIIDPELLEILVCPESRQPVKLAGEALVERLNVAQSEGKLKNRAGRKVEQPMQAGLIRDDRAFLYPIIDDIPVMLIDEAIPLEGFLSLDKEA